MVKQAKQAKQHDSRQLKVIETRTYHDGALVMVHMRGPGVPVSWWFQWARETVEAPWQLTWDGREATWAAWHLGKVVGPSQKRFRRHYIRKHKQAQDRRQGGSSSCSPSSSLKVATPRAEVG